MLEEEFLVIANKNNIFGHLSHYDIFYQGEHMKITEENLKEFLHSYVEVMKEEHNRKQHNLKGTQ